MFWEFWDQGSGLEYVVCRAYMLSEGLWGFAKAKQP